MYQLQHDMYPFIGVQLHSVAEVKDPTTGQICLKVLASLQLVRAAFGRPHPQVVLHADVAQRNLLRSVGDVTTWVPAILKATVAPARQLHTRPHVAITHLIFPDATALNDGRHIRVEREYLGANDPLASVFNP